MFATSEIPLRWHQYESNHLIEPVTIPILVDRAGFTDRHTHPLPYSIARCPKSQISLDIKGLVTTQAAPLTADGPERPSYRINSQ